MQPDKKSNHASRQLDPCGKKEDKKKRKDKRQCKFLTCTVLDVNSGCTWRVSSTKHIRRSRTTYCQG